MLSTLKVRRQLPAQGSQELSCSTIEPPEVQLKAKCGEKPCMKSAACHFCAQRVHGRCLETNMFNSLDSV